ncbi:hypothetical protein GQ600_20324 [Phytophthora cactorum]|nr:hypothetical protein GQ600_20324 [Phytophthora cactorum]
MITAGQATLCSTRVIDYVEMSVRFYDQSGSLEFHGRIATLKSQFPSPIVRRQTKLRKAAGEHAELLAIGRNNQLQVAKAQSAISGCMIRFIKRSEGDSILLGKLSCELFSFSNAPGGITQGGYDSYPLHSKIRLGEDWDQRRATLLSIREERYVQHTTL